MQGNGADKSAAVVLKDIRMDQEGTKQGGILAQWHAQQALRIKTRRKVFPHYHLPWMRVDGTRAPR